MLHPRRVSRREGPLKVAERCACRNAPSRHTHTRTHSSVRVQTRQRQAEAEAAAAAQRAAESDAQCARASATVATMKARVEEQERSTAGVVASVKQSLALMEAEKKGIAKVRPRAPLAGAAERRCGESAGGARVGDDNAPLACPPHARRPHSERCLQRRG